MQVKVTMSDKEKKIAIAILLIALIIIYCINKRYLFILDVQFENDSPKKLLLKTGFVFPVKTEIDLGDKPVEMKVKWYGYLVKTVPIIDPETKVFAGEVKVNIYKNSKSIEPFKSIVMHNDSYYVQYFKTPLGRL